MDYFDKRDYLTEETGSNDERSEITDFFEGATVLITGVTGFIGHLVFEKILRCCPGVKRVFIILRKKKGKSPEERFRELLKNELFYELWKSNPKFLNKVEVITGDCSHPQLDISPEAREKLKETNIIIHIAALLQFDEHFRSSFNTNVLGTKALLELAKEIKNLKVFTYVSTAYVDVNNKYLEEDFIKPVYGFKEMKTVIDNCTNDEITGLMPFLRGNSTSYSLMKSIAEKVVEDYKDTVSIGIVRPSIVMNTHREPLARWMNGLNGHAAIIMGCILGLVRVANLKEANIFDAVPADKVTSAIMASTWDIATNKPLKPVYNVVSWKKSSITWSKFREYLLEAQVVLQLSSKYGVWKPFTIYTTSRVLYKTLTLLLHIIPAILGDAILRIKKQKPMLLKLYRKAFYLTELLYIYTGSDWFFKDDHLYSVWEKMSPTDKMKYNFSMENFDWKDYNSFYIRGVQSYTLNERPNCDEIIRSRRKYYWLEVLHYTVCTIFWVSVLLLLKCFII